MENSVLSTSCCDSVCSACELIPPALLQAIPKEQKRIKFEELRGGGDYALNFIVGKVFMPFPISQRANGFFRKLLLSEAAEKQGEEKSTKMLNLFILNEDQEQLDSIDQKSFVAVSGFKVEKLTCKSDENTLPVQILAIIRRDSKDSTMMWIARSVSQSLDESACSSSQVSEEGSMDCDDPESLSTDEEEEYEALEKEYSQRELPDSDESDEITIESAELPLADGPDVASTRSNEDDIDEKPNPVPETSSRSYNYVQLNELKESITPDQNFNIYGIVVNCYFRPSAPDRDKILELILKDSTMDFFKFRVIGRCNDKFPDVYPGDIIRVHRMLVDKFRDKLKGKCFSPKFIVVFDGKTNDFKTRCVAKTFVFTMDDKKLVQNLRLHANKKQTAKWITEINMDDFVTVICQVVTIYVVRSESVLLKVWDGTVSPILVTDRTKNIMCGKMDERLFNVSKNYLVPVWINGDYTIAAAELKPGQFIKLCDVHLYAPKSKPDEPRLCIHPQTKPGRGVVLLDAKDDTVQELKSRLQIIWDEAKAAEEITMDDTPSFMKDMDTSDMMPGCSSNSVAPESAASRFEEPDTSGDDVRVQQSVDASQAMSAADVESQQLLISTLNQGIEPASNMQCTAGAPVLAANGELPQENVEGTTANEGSFPPPDIERSPAIKDRGKRTNADFNGNASKKQKVDNHGTNGVSPSSVPKDVASHVSGSNNAAPPSPDSQTAVNAPRSIAESSPVLNSNIRRQSDWWKSMKTVSESIGHQHIEPFFLNKVVEHFVPYKFRLFVTVLNIDPELDDTEKLIRVYCPQCHYLSEDAKPDLDVCEVRNKVPFYYCPECSSEKSSVPGGVSANQVLEYIFLVRLHLHDGTGTIEAFLWKENAVKFFKGIKPEDALSDRSKAILVRQMLWDICPNCCPFEPANGTSQASSHGGSYYPILDCCVMSYTAGDIIRYQIFDTRLN